MNRNERRTVMLVALFLISSGAGITTDMMLGRTTGSLFAGLGLGLVAGIITIALLLPWTERGR